MNNPEYPSSWMYYDRFGTWNNALEMAGLDKALKLVGLDVDTMAKKGILDTSQQKARLLEMYVIEHFDYRFVWRKSEQSL